VIDRADQLRERVLKDAEDAGLELTRVEQEALDRACHLATVVEGIDAVLEEEGLTCSGPGGTRVHPLVPERRNTIALIQRIVGSIQLDPAKAGESPSQQARRAASARWKNKPSPANIRPRKRKLPDAV
jgi:hypothetical protein